MEEGVFNKNILIDTHAHLTDKMFDEDREDLIASFKDYGVGFVVTSGFNYPSSVGAVKLAEKHDGMFASVGVYPENIAELDKETFVLLKNLAQSEKVVAVGEIGLQYTDNMPEREIQKQGFIRQLELASALKLPVVIHCREAYGDMLQLLKEHKYLLGASGTMHCFSGSKEMAKEFVKLGLYISVGGVSTFKNAENVREMILEVPMDRILLETDCPYLAPHPYRSKRNSPCFLPTIAENLAVLKGASVDEIARVTTKNARELFRI